jgi:hypothetical protein
MNFTIKELENQMETKVLIDHFNWWMHKINSMDKYKEQLEEYCQAHNLSCTFGTDYVDVEWIRFKLQDDQIVMVNLDGKIQDISKYSAVQGFYQFFSSILEKEVDPRLEKFKDFLMKNGISFQSKDNRIRVEGIWVRLDDSAIYVEEHEVPMETKNYFSWLTFLGTLND